MGTGVLVGFVVGTGVGATVGIFPFVCVSVDWAVGVRAGLSNAVGTWAMVTAGGELGGLTVVGLLVAVAV